MKVMNLVHQLDELNPQKDRVAAVLVLFFLFRYLSAAVPHQLHPEIFG
jgi:hypothetical protein